jgi:hypothetical protein
LIVKLLSGLRLRRYRERNKACTHTDEVVDEILHVRRVYRDRLPLEIVAERPEGTPTGCIMATYYGTPYKLVLSHHFAI